MKRDEIKSMVFSFSHGLFGTITDLTLFFCFLTLTSSGKPPTSYGWDRAFNESYALLSEFNYKTILKALTDLKRNQLISYSPKKRNQTLKITRKGHAYINQRLPEYQSKRHWDGRIYLITYDIPEVHRRHREMLRQYVRKLGGGMLQESVWLLFKNPKSLLQAFIKEKQLSGVIVISDMGQNATIGDEDLLTLISKIYHLDSINSRYKSFLTQLRGKNRFLPLDASLYLSILKDDPQLPFELLPHDWCGEKARALYVRYSRQLLTNG